MNFINLLNCKNKEEFINWLKVNSTSQKECWVKCIRGKRTNEDIFHYIDAVYIALAYGWIDSTVRKIDGETIQRFSPRRKNSYWSELNKERCRWLIGHDLMTSEGFKTLPEDFNEKFVIDEDILDLLKADEIIWTNFNNFHPLYKRIKIANIQKERKNQELFEKKLNNFLVKTKENKLYGGNWNDDGRLL